MCVAKLAMRRTGIEVSASILSFSRISGAASVLLVAGSTLCAQNSIPTANRWLLNNGLVSRAIAFDAHDGIVTQSWKNLTNDREFIGPE